MGFFSAAVARYVQAVGYHQSANGQQQAAAARMRAFEMLACCNPTFSKYGQSLTGKLKSFILFIMGQF